MDLRSSSITCVVCFLIGFLTAPDYNISIFSGESNTASDVNYGSVLERQKYAHASFQAQIEGIQTTCGGRTLKLSANTISPVGANDAEEFARAFQFLALALQVSVATERALVLDDDWVLLPGNDSKDNNNCEATIHRHSIGCLPNSVQSSKCSMDTSAKNRKGIRETPKLASSALAYGIIPGIPITKDNALFHAGYYGPEPIMEMPSWPYPKDTYLIDVVPRWERSFGRFWVRAQMVHYLWDQWQPQVTSNPEDAPYIAFYWSSCPKLRKNLAVKYGRNATETQSFRRYMEVATRIRQEQDLTAIQTIFLVSDGVENGVSMPDRQRLEQEYPNWTFVELPVKEGEKGMLAGLEVLRRADFLVGSFQSQMFRAAAELNAAWFGSKYPVSMKRHWAVDVEWFENP